MRSVRYRVEDDTLIVEGDFLALSSGVCGGWGEVDSIFNHTIGDAHIHDPKAYLRRIAAKFSLKRYFGLLTSVPMDKLAVVRRDDVTVFATAGVRNPNCRINAVNEVKGKDKETIGTINLIAVVENDVDPAAMVNAVITVTEAKSFALLREGYDFTGTNTDAVVIAKTGGKRFYEYSGPASSLGAKIWDAVVEAVTGSLRKW